ncbi:VRR-NUC domain-containing protein [Atlantibacter hermannii]|uniref:VRR-NUC domain-containing protein n=1 Tax=Atlantibacter hermannii TaxID=565 RepID=UPI0028A2CB08|nr:VRR-NUC domain-containing protein [Atlantibacter hermannii]
MRFTSEWLEGYTKKKGSTAQSKRSAQASPLTFLNVASKISVHAAALAAVIKKPELRKGKYEHYDQVQIFDFIERKHPELYPLLHATPNGGYRTKKTANDMAAEGQKAGYPDMSLDLPSGLYHGMRIELKHGKRKPSEEQIGYMRRLDAQGYYCLLAFSPDEAIEAIKQYACLSPGAAMPQHANDEYWRER